MRRNAGSVNPFYLSIIVVSLGIALGGCTRKKETIPGLTGPAADVFELHSSLEILNPGSFVADGIQAVQVEVSLMNAEAGPVEGVVPVLSASGEGVIASVCSSSNAQGISVCEIASTKAEVKLIQMTWPVVVAGDSVSFVAGPAAKLCYFIQPGGGIAGQTWIFQPVIRVGDSHCNLVSTSTAQVDLALQSGTGALLGTAFTNAVAGVASFSGLNIQLSGAKSIRATSAGLVAADSSSFQILPDLAVGLEFSTQPGGGSALQVWSGQPRVRLVDSFGNTATTSSAAVNLTKISGNGVLAGAIARNTSSGVAYFSGLNIDKVGADKVLRATAPGLNWVDSNSFVITAGPAAKLGFQTEPGGGAAGLVWAVQPSVQIFDVADNPVSDSGVAITLNVSSGAGSLFGPKTVNSISGLSSFANLFMSTSGSDKVLTASAPGLTSGTSAVFSISAGLPSRICITTHPGNGIAGLALSAQPVFFIGDSDCTLVPSETSPVALSVSSGSGALIGTGTVSAVAGVATFSGLSMNVAGPKKITASSAGLSSVETDQFTILPGAVSATESKLSSTGSPLWPNGADSGQMTVVLKDNFGNLISGKSVSLSSNRAANDVVVGSPGTTDASGSVSFMVSSNLAGTSVYSALGDGVSISDTADLIFQSMVPSALHSSWQIFPASLPADALKTGTLSVVVRNNLNNPIPGKTVNIGSNRGVSDLFNFSNQVSNASGEVQFTVASALVGESLLQLSVPADSVTLSSSIPVNFYHSSPLGDWQGRSYGSSVNQWVDWAKAIVGQLNGFSGTEWQAQSLAFDGHSDFVNLQNGFNATSDVTFEVWAKSYDPAGSGKVIFANGHEDGTGITLRQSWIESREVELSLGHQRSFAASMFDIDAVAYFKLDETSGAVAKATKGGVSGAYSGGYTLGQGTALLENRSSVLFNGSSGHVDFGNNYEGTDNHTIEAWVYPTSIAGTRPIVSKMPLLGLGGFSLELVGGKASFKVINLLLLTHTVTGTTTLPLNQWSHVAAVRDAGANELRIYVNGVLENTSSVLLDGVGITGEDFLIGKQGLNHFQGRIDEVGIFDIVLSDAEILTHYQSKDVPVCYSQTLLPSNAWMHIAASFNGASDELKLYMNGAASPECTLSVPGRNYSGTTYPMSLGAPVDQTNSVIQATQHFFGEIGEFKGFGSVLTGSQINDHKTAGQSRY